MSFYTSKI